MKIALLSDIHSNIYALEAVLEDCKSEGVAYFIVAGDLIGYYYWPKPVIQRLMNGSRITCIRGNHEDILAQTLKSNAAAQRYRQKYGSGYDVCRETLSDDELEWLLHLPEKAWLTLEGVSFGVHHGSPGATNKYIYPDASLNTLVACYDRADYTILGHTHYSFVHHFSGRILLNPGSVGQPRDKGGHACYALLNLANNALRFKRVSYDTQPVVQQAKVRDPTLSYLHKVITRGES